MSSPPDFLPTRAAALARLEEFLPDAGRYAADRNFVRPGHPNTSRLSPWVQKRLLLEEEVIAAARDRWSFEAVEKFVQEVYWRTYWKGWLEQRPEAWSRWVEAVPRLRDALSAEQRSTLEAALAGGLDAPFACKAGVCSTCKCKVIEGEVEMVSNHALEDYEVEQGFVLSCQSFALTQKVIVDYDQH